MTTIHRRALSTLAVLALLALLHAVFSAYLRPDLVVDFLNHAFWC